MNYYVTTSIPYVNGGPHLGHALEFCMQMFWPGTQDSKTPTLFVTGTDEHGSKIAEKANEAGHYSTAVGERK